MAEILKVNDLYVDINSPASTVHAVRGVSFAVSQGEVLAIVGESGCGKSMLLKACMKLLPRSGSITTGTVELMGTDITNYSSREMQKIRGKLFSMIFQDPLTALDPTMTVGKQLEEAVLVHNPKMKKDDVKNRVLELMDLVGIPQPQVRRDQHPHSFSGGMRQRAVMSMALASDPKILLADELTTALDVTVQAQMLRLIREIQGKLGTSTLLVSHDLGVVAGVADRVAVMYAGKIVEIGTAEEVYHDPRHPYTWALLRSLPAYSRGKGELYAIPGMPPSLIDPPKGDAFACRNPYALAIDHEEAPPMFKITDTHYAATWLLDPRAPKVTPPVGGGKNE